MSMATDTWVFLIPKQHFLYVLVLFIIYLEITDARWLKALNDNSSAHLECHGRVSLQ